jgi:hypothetical protein
VREHHDGASTDHLLERRSTVEHIMHDQPALTGRVVVDALALDEVLVIDTDGTTLASRPVPREVRSEEGWDRALFNLGYVRTSDWAATEGGHRCAVEPSRSAG